MKKKLAMIMAVISVLMLVLAVSASATEVKVHSESGNVFTKAWTKTKYFDSECGIAEVAFNTFAFDEDTIKVFHTTKTHSGRVVAGSKQAQTGNKAAGAWTSRADVRHASGTINWYASY